MNMITIEQRDHVRNHVLEMAKSDSRVTAGALIGSMALGMEDQWSDVDIGFGIEEGHNSEVVLDDWTEALDREFGVLHHWDLRSGASIYRVLLFASGIEVDLSVTPERDFGARGPNFRTLFGTTQQLEPPPPPEPRYQIGLGWHHILHARSAIERGKAWQAEYWISGIRDQAFILACLRLGEETYSARGVHRLPAGVTTPMADALVRSLDEPELRRAMAVATRCFIREVEAYDPVLGGRLKPLLMQIVNPQ